MKADGVKTAHVVYRNCGATKESTNISNLLLHMCLEITGIYDPESVSLIWKRFKRQTASGVQEVFRKETIFLPTDAEPLLIIIDQVSLRGCMQIQ